MLAVAPGSEVEGEEAATTCGATEIGSLGNGEMGKLRENGGMERE